MRFKKSLSLLLALIMAFGAIPFIAGGMIASAVLDQTKALSSIATSVTGEVKMQVGDAKDITVYATLEDGTGEFVSEGVTWASTDMTAVIVEGGKLKALKATTAPVTITAVFIHAGTPKTATFTVSVTEKPLEVNSISWKWPNAKVVAGLTYSFKDLYTLSPVNPSDKSVVLTCSPETAVQIDNEKQTFTVNPITAKTEEIQLTLTANGASALCTPAKLNVLVYADVPIEKVVWDYKLDANGKTQFLYYEKVNGIKEVAEYNYEYKSGDTMVYKYHTVPEDLRALCTFTVESGNERVIKVDAATKRLIPVGNGEAVITITAKTPGGVKKTAKMTVVVGYHSSYADTSEAPYTPIDGINLNINKDKSASTAEVTTDATTKKVTKISAHFGSTIMMTATPTTKANVKNVQPTLSNKSVKLEINGVSTEVVKPCTYTWTSSDESVIKIDAKTGKATALSKGTATIKIVGEDNGVKFEESVKVECSVYWWEALVGILACIFTGRFSEIKRFF